MAGAIHGGLRWLAGGTTTPTNVSSDDAVVTMMGSLGMQVASRFARSLRETGARCRLVMLLPESDSSRNIIAALAEWRAEPHYYVSTKPPYTALRGNRAKLIRYWAALEYLLAHPGTGRVLLADSLDVVFQRDPFTIAADPARPLDVFMEDYFRNFANSGINQGHVVPCFGNEAVRRTFLSPPRPVSCSGVTMGTRDAVVRYLRLMWSEMRQPRYSDACLQHDQAFHNWLLWAGKLSPVRAWSNEAGPVTTVGWPEHLYRDRFGRVLNRAGELVHIVHQYDRRKRLLASLGRRYTLVDRPEAPPRTAAPVDTASAFTGGGWLEGRSLRRRDEAEAVRLDGRIGVDADNLAP